MLDSESTTNVLVTHYVGSQDHGDDNSDTFEEVVSRANDNAWPPGHTAYLEFQKASVCLEIAGGGKHLLPSYDRSSGLLTPGSLRNRGDFSIVTLEIASNGAFQWSVKTVEHLSIPCYERR